MADDLFLRVNRLERQMEMLKLHIDTLYREGDHMALDISKLESQVKILEDREQAREARDEAQDKVTAEQIASLNAAVATLQAIIDAGTVDPAVQASIDAVTDRIGKVIVSLDAADPTSPVA